MAPLPRRSDGLLTALIGDGVAVYDLVTEMRHLLSPVGGFVLTACDGTTTAEVAGLELAEAAEVDPASAGERVTTTLEELRGIGLIGRDTVWNPPEPRGVLSRELTEEQRRVLLTACSAETTSARHAVAEVVGVPHRVLDRTIRFRGEDPKLIATIDDYLGTGESAPARGDHSDDGGDSDRHEAGRRTAAPKDPSTLEFGVYETEEDEYDLVTDDIVGHEGLGTLLRRLVTVTNEYAAASTTLLTLHAGSVRDPDGRIVTFPAESGAGKSTLTAAFVARGWDYLGDEVIGFSPDGTTYGYPKRIAIFTHSRAVVGLDPDPDRNTDPSTIHSRVERLGGPVGPTDLFLFPEFEAGAQLASEPLDALGAFDGLLANTLNLARVEQTGLDTLVGLAGTVPAHRLTHGDALDAVDAVAELLDRSGDRAAQVL